MKTISNLIRDIFAAHRTDRGRKPVIEEHKPETYKNDDVNNDNKNGNNNQNNTNYETKDHEISGNPGMDNPHVGESDGPAQEASLQPLASEQQATESGERGESGEGNSTIDEEALRKAFEEGVIAGRNQKIEETYFPKKDVEIPVFRGMPSRAGVSGDIFSIAREA